MIRNILKPCFNQPFLGSIRSYATVVDKASLSQLRKKTGIGFMNCRKALEQFENDVDKAEKWLLEQAQKEGWAKATKLQGRPMSQGLVGVVSDNQRATLVEINCETDFVAKNEKFHDLVSNVTSGCHRYFMAAPTSTQVNKNIFFRKSSCVRCQLRHFSTMRPSYIKSKASSQRSKRRKVELAEREENSPCFLFDYEDIPKVTGRPAVERLAGGGYTWIYFDLETTGFGFSNITQISASVDDQLFTRYVLPRKPISRMASHLTGLTYVGGKLYKNGESLEAVSATKCMSDFADWLCNFLSPVLVAHNALFDALVLCNCLTEIKDQRVSYLVDGFVDTLSVFRIAIPNRTHYNLESLITDILGIKYRAHDASQDVEILQKLVQSEKISNNLMCQSSYTFSYVQDYVAYKKQIDECRGSLQPLVKKAVLTKNQVNKIAKNGLGLYHLEIVHRRAGVKGIHNVFTDNSHGKSRIMTDRNVINKIADFLESSERKLS